MNKTVHLIDVGIDERILLKQILKTQDLRTWNEFYVLLTVHPSTTLGKWPAWCTITLYKTFIIITLYMFRATLRSSSGGQIVLITASGIVFSVSDRPVCRLTCTQDSHREYYTRCCINTIWPADDEQSCSKHVEDYNNKRII